MEGSPEYISSPLFLVDCARFSDGGNSLGAFSSCCLDVCESYD